MSIIDRVQKLLALSKSSNPHEAANAAALADKLIQKHQLTEAELVASNNAEVAERPDQYKDPIYSTARRTAWKSHLASNLARHYDCAVFIQTGYREKKTESKNPFARYKAANKESAYMLVGRKEDCELAIYMFSWITNEIERLAKENAYGKGHQYSQTYCEGAGAGVMEKIRSEKEAFRAEAQKEGKGAAIVLLDRKAIESSEKLNNLYPKLRVTNALSGARSKDASAYSSGYSAGKNMNVARGMGGKASSGGLLGG
jgi:hypothetical protein